MMPTVRFNIHFQKSLEDCGILLNAGLANSTLRAVVHTIENVHMAATHPLREGSGPNEAQVRRGKDLAWRRDIDHEYHLHYWQCPGGLVELACVVTHNDFHICF